MSKKGEGVKPCETWRWMHHPVGCFSKSNAAQQKVTPHFSDWFKKFGAFGGNVTQKLDGFNTLE